jgi:hypothetical protein
MPNLIQDFDCIGFDMDHTLVKYDVKALSRLIVETYLIELHEKFKYPHRIFDFDYDNHMALA